VVKARSLRRNAEDHDPPAAHAALGQQVARVRHELAVRRSVSSFTPVHGLAGASLRVRLAGKKSFDFGKVRPADFADAAGFGGQVRLKKAA